MPAQPPRRADARRNYERLLDAAGAVLDERGAGASLDDIASIAGVGNATLYRHFAGRGELIEAVYDQRIRSLCESAAEWGRTSSEPEAALVGWLREVVVHITRSRVLGEAFLAAHPEPGGAEPPQIARWHEAVAVVASTLLGPAQAAGAVRADLDAHALMALTAAVARAGSAADAERYLDVLLEGVVTPKR